MNDSYFSEPARRRNLQLARSSRSCLMPHPCPSPKPWSLRASCSHLRFLFWS